MSGSNTIHFHSNLTQHLSDAFYQPYSYYSQFWVSRILPRTAPLPYIVYTQLHMFSLKFEALFGKNDLFIYSATRSMTRCHFSKSRTNFISNASGLMKFMIIKTGFSQSPIAIVHFQPGLGSLHTHLVDSKRMQMWCLMCSLTGQIQSLAQKKVSSDPFLKFIQLKKMPWYCSECLQKSCVFRDLMTISRFL